MLSCLHENVLQGAELENVVLGMVVLGSPSLMLATVPEIEEQNEGADND